MITQEDCVRDSLGFGLRKGYQLLVMYLALFGFSLLTGRWAASVELPVLKLVIQLIPALLFGLPLVRTTLAIVEQRPLRSEDLLCSFSLLNLKLFFYNVLILVVAAVGFVLLLVPGFYWICTFIVTPYILATENIGIIAAMKKSITYTRGVRLRIFSVLMFALLGTLILSALGAALTIWAFPPSPITPEHWQYRDYALMGVYTVVMCWVSAVGNLAMAWIYKRLPARR